MCICKTSDIDITPIMWLPFFILTSFNIGSSTAVKFNLENVGIAVGILLLCALELKICLGTHFSFPLFPLLRCWQMLQKTVAGTRVKASYLVI